MAIEEEFAKNSGNNTSPEKLKRHKSPDGEEKVYHVRTSDKEVFLKEAFKRNKWEGFTLVFRHYYSPMCSHAVRYVYSKSYAEDIVSEVFMEFWRKQHFEKVTTTYRAYLFRAVRNRALNFIRDEWGQETEVLPENTLLSGRVTPDEHIMYEQFYQKVQKNIENLPPKCKKIFLMSRYEGMSHKDIARIQDISTRTVEGHISKALQIMREALDYTG